MKVHSIWRFLALIFVLVYFYVMSSRTFQQNEEVDFKFQINMGKDINRIARELKETELEEKAIHILKYSLHDVQRNTQSYVQSRSYDQFDSLILIFIAMIFATSCITPPSGRVNHKKPMT